MANVAAEATPKKGPTIGANELLALVGGIIVAGFLGNLLFKYAKIPSVIKLMALGILLGPVLGWADKETLAGITPFFGKLALLIILFAGGLKLNIETVIQQLGKAVYLAVLAFTATFALSFAASYFFILEGMVLQSVILSVLVAGTASSIVIPVVNKLSVGEGVKSLLSIESALSNLLILIVVVVVCDFSAGQDAGESTNLVSVFIDFIIKIVVSIVMAAGFGILWSRIMGAMRNESLGYMLTLGFIFLLNYLVDYLGGSGPISILFFAIVLANVSRTTAAWAPKLQAFFGIQVDAANYSLNEFLTGIAGELSFLFTTFFFVLLGTQVEFDELNLEILLHIGLLSLAIILGRFLIMPIFMGRKKSPPGDKAIIFAMMPRGLATAVMAFLPATQYSIEHTEAFPTYAMFAILISNLFMTLFVAIGEMQLKRAGRIAETDAKNAKKEDAEDAAVVSVEENAEENPEKVDDSPEVDEENDTAKSKAEARLQAELELYKQHSISKEVPESAREVDPIPEPDETLTAEERAEARLKAEMTIYRRASGKEEAEEEEKPKSFIQHLHGWLGLSQQGFEDLDRNSIRSIRMRDPIFWVRLVFTILITALGVMMDRSEVILVAMLFSPVAPLMNTLGFSILSGDVYMFLKGTVKTLFMIVLVVGTATLLAAFTPFTGIPDEVTQRIEPTVLDFVLAVLGGIIAPIVLLRNKRLEMLAITPLISILIFPPLVIVGYALGAGLERDFFREVLAGGTLSFSANFTAMLLGTLLSQGIIGLTHHKASEYVKAWKAKEIEQGFLHRWFERLRLVRFLEYVGTPIARATVLLILAAALFVPLQLTFNQVKYDYNTSQAVGTYAYAHFEVPDRSSIISTNYTHQEDMVSVKVRVATNKYFTTEDVQAFENEVSNDLDIPVTLSLVQSLGHVSPVSDINLDQGGLTSDLGVTGSSLSQQIELLRSNLADAIRSLPSEGDFTVFEYNTAFGMDTAGFSVNVNYLAPQPLNSYAEALMQQNIADKVGLEPGAIYLNHFPDRYFSEGPDLAEFADSSGQTSLTDILGKSGRLHVLIGGPTSDEGVIRLDSIKLSLREAHRGIEVKVDSANSPVYFVDFE